MAVFAYFLDFLKYFHMNTDLQDHFLAIIKIVRMAVYFDKY